MSDGGGESVRDNYERSKTKNRNDDFAQAIAKIAVAQVCESVGFQSFQQSALNTLSDVVVRYIREIGKTANNCSNLAGRTESNLFDIIQGLEDLGSLQGFSGASDINRCLAGSGVVQEITQYVGESEEIPFAYCIPEFPVVKDRNPNPSFVQVGETFPDDHVPPWLPAFPDPQTYLNSPSRNDRELDTRMVEIKHGKEQRKVERSLLNLQHRLACNGSDVSTVFEPVDAAKAKQAAESNQFLVAPLRFGEKEVSSMALLPKVLDGAAARSNELVQNHVSALETFTPAIEAMPEPPLGEELQGAASPAPQLADMELDSEEPLGVASPAPQLADMGLDSEELPGVASPAPQLADMELDSEEGRKKVLLKARSAIQFKIRIGRKSLGPSTNLWNGDIEKMNSWFGGNNEKSNKKGRAEQIMEESTEDTQELAQL